MTLRFRETPERIIVYFTDAMFLDESRIQESEKGLRDICQRAADATKKLIFDFRDVQFMSSAMLGQLILINKFAKQNSLDLRLANIGGNVLDVLKLTRLNKVIRFDDDGPDLLGEPVPLPKPPST